MEVSPFLHMYMTNTLLVFRNIYYIISVSLGKLINGFVPSIPIYIYYPPHRVVVKSKFTNTLKPETNARHKINAQ